VVTSEVLWALKRAVTPRQGAPDECWKNYICSGLARLQPGECELAGLPCVGSLVTANQPVFLALAAG
jgi:hypothetical protein